MIHWLAFLLLSCLVSAAPARTPSLPAPLVMDGENFGEVWVYAGEETELGTNSLLKAMERAMQPDPLASLRASLAGSETVSLPRLNELGLTIRFDPNTLILLMQLEDSLRARKNLQVRRENEADRVTLGPALFSGYLNATATQGFSYPRAGQARQPFRGNLSLASNWSGYVLETGATYTESREYEWTRDDTRLVKDLEGRMLRFTLGDQPVNASSYQNSRLMGGVSITRQYSIQPYLNTRPLNRTEIQVKRPSSIEIYVNGGFVNRVSAGPGPVQLSDFPLFSGVNKVDLKITDDAGNVEWLNLNLLYDVQLLGEGIQQFSYQVGAPSENLRNDRRYDDRNLTFSAFHRAGLSDRFTMGAGFQSDRHIALLTSDMVLLTRGGLFSWEGGLSRLSTGLTAGAGKIRYKSLDYKLGSDRPLRGTAEVEYKSMLFGGIGQPNPLNTYSWKYDLSLSRPITPSTNAAVGFQYLVNRLRPEDMKAFRLDFNSELSREWRATFNYTLERESRTSHRFQVALSWLESTGKYFGNLSYDYPSKTTRIEASRNPSTLVDDFRVNLGAQRSPSALQGDALLEYTHEKGNLRAEHSSVRYANRAEGHKIANTTTFTAAAAVAWAGGAVALTRPISDSFVLIKAKPLYRDFPIPVNRVEDTAEATVNRLGPAVVPTLTSYNETPVRLDSSRLPIGYSLGREYALARPTYRSGIRLDVGGDSTVVVSGRLLLPGGEPLALATGKVSGTAGQFAFFTNREGAFLLEHLPPGDYVLEVDDASFAPWMFSIGKDQVGFLKMPPHELKGIDQ